MKAQIVQRIIDLGGTVESSEESTSIELMPSVKFSLPIYQKDEDGDMYKYRVDDFYRENIDLYKDDPQTFFDNLIKQHFSDDETPRRQSFWRGALFTPFTEGTADFNEWTYDFNEESDLINISAVREIVGDGELQFVQLTYVYGYPDHFYVCLQDPEPENPTVFGTDHETFFSEIHTYGRLLDFFENHYTQDEFHAAAANYLNDQAG